MSGIIEHRPDGQYRISCRVWSVLGGGGGGDDNDVDNDAADDDSNKTAHLHYHDDDDNDNKPLYAVNYKTNKKQKMP